MYGIRIQLMSDLCVGNGESVGYGIDSDICKDNYGFPYIPGRRILGCLRDAAEKLKEYGLNEATEEAIDFIFGDADSLEGKLCISNAYIPGFDAMHGYILSLKDEDPKRDYLIRQSTEDKIIKMFSSVRGQTRIGNDGKAENGSLRFVRVLNQYDPMTHKPMEFCCQADLSALNEEQVKLVLKSCKTLRHIGLERNRGLGNVKVTLEPDRDRSHQETTVWSALDNCVLGNAEQLCISYQVRFDSPVTVQEYLESGSQIKARTMIGIFAGLYLNKYKQADEVFNKLFLDGTVRWSALTPVINGINSDPVPAMFMKLKNGGGEIINSFTADDPEWRKKKPKSLEGYFIAIDETQSVCYVAQPETEINYHNRINGSKGIDREKKGLYMQESLKQGMVYGGSVFLPGEMYDAVKEILKIQQIRVGRSKKVQYGTAVIQKAEPSVYNPISILPEDGEAVFAILKSDLVFQENAGIKIDNGYVRSRIAEASGLENSLPEGFYDICRYHVLSGYNAMWHMQKPKIQAVMGGSVYCFCGKKGKYLSELVLGEYQQEGMGVIKLVTLKNLKNMGTVRKGKISVKQSETDRETVQRLENMILYEAVLAQFNEYAFLFSKANKSLMENLPSRRLRQMLLDADDIASLWEMVKNMKTSDVSSESEGKLAKVIKLLEQFYGKEQDEIDFEKMIDDARLLEEVKKNEDVYERIKKRWKEPLLTLLQMAHYQKSME